jgi:hypothetical protein
MRRLTSTVTNVTKAHKGSGLDDGNSDILAHLTASYLGVHQPDCKDLQLASPRGNNSA